MTWEKFLCLLRVKPRVLTVASEALRDPPWGPSSEPLSYYAFPCSLYSSPTYLCTVSWTNWASSLQRPWYSLFPLLGLLSTHMSARLIFSPPWSVCSCLILISLPLTTYYKWRLPPCLPREPSRLYLFQLYFLIEMTCFWHTIYF